MGNKHGIVVFQLRQGHQELLYSVSSMLLSALTRESTRADSTQAFANWASQ